MPPTTRPEREFARELGVRLVAGIDEAGRGPLAGPVVAGAVIFGPELRRPSGLDDSKKLTRAARERLEPLIKSKATAWGVGVATAQEIDEINILAATKLAVRRAVESLPIEPEALITDALELPAIALPQRALIRGDAKSAAIAAASILAKVERDRMMDVYDEEFPGYGWASNRGYPTPDHLDALSRLGPTVLHRMTFANVGFFDEELRRSRSFHRIRDAMESGGDPGTLFRQLRHRLPPPDISELEAALTASRPRPEESAR